MTRFFRSTSVRLALGFAGLFITSSLILAGILWWQTASYLDREIDAVILADANAVGDGLRNSGLRGAVEAINARVGRSGDANALYFLADPLLKPIAGNLGAWPLSVPQVTGWYQADLVHGGELHETRLLHVQLPEGFHLLIGRDVHDREAIRRSILTGLSWAGAAALVLAVLGGLLVRRAALQRVDLINRTAAAIVEGDLAHRVPVRQTGDEFDQLATTVNRMLEQIQLLVEGVRNVSNAIAHDLRTPLAELRVRLEELSAKRPPPDETFSGIDAAVGDIDRVIAMFNALLRLAEIDSGVRRAGFRPVALTELVEEVAELYDATAEAKGIGLAVKAESGLIINGDPYLLAQAIGNLVDNAVKYAPPQGHVSLSLAHTSDGHIAATVADDGPGIPDAEKDHVTERFFRGDASRGSPGVGLGLSLVAGVARLHGGKLILADGNPGLVASLVL